MDAKNIREPLAPGHGTRAHRARVKARVYARCDGLVQAQGPGESYRAMVRARGGAIQRHEGNNNDYLGPSRYRVPYSVLHF